METSNFRVTRRWRSRDLSDIRSSRKELRSGDDRDVSVEEIVRARCAVLLGPPGAGKSTDLEWLKSSSGDSVQVVRMVGPSSQESLIRRILDGPVCRLARQNPDAAPLLALDGVDESPLSAGSLVDVFENELGELPDNLRVALACRTAAWPIALEPALISRFGQVAVYEISPLGLGDVEEFARLSGVNPSRFLALLKGAKAEGLAGNPNSLRLFISQYKDQESAGEDIRLSPSQRDLYEQSCRSLLVEPNPSRLPPTVPVNLAPNLAIAGHLATVALFSASTSFVLPPIVVGEGRELAPGDLVPAYVRVSGAHDGPPQILTLEETDVIRILGTAAFSGRGRSRVGFGHQTLAEYLSARYLVSINAPLSAIERLIGLGEGRIPSQVQVVAAWLIAMKPALFNDLLKQDPESFIRSGIELDDSDYRKMLMEGLLDLAHQNEIADIRSLAISLTGLTFDGIETLLTRWFSSSEASLDSRYLAIRVARVNKLTRCVGHLLDLARNRDAEVILRNSAAWGVLDLGQPGQVQQLCSLTDDEHRGDDPDDELYGIGLRALLRSGGSIASIFGLLKERSNSDLFGNYEGFLRRDLPEALTVPDLPVKDLLVGLQWIADREGEERDVQSQTFSGFGAVSDAVLVAALQRLEVPTVVDATAKYVLARLRRFEGLFHERDSDFPDIPDDRRRRLISKIGQDLLKEGGRRALVWPATRSLLQGTDFRWLVGQSLRADDEEAARLWASAARFVVDPSRSDHIEYIEGLPSGSVAADELRYVIAPPDVFEPDADARSEEQGTAATADELRRRLLSILDDEFHDDSLTHFFYWLQFADGERRSERGFELDITRLPGWALLRDAERAKVLDLARWHLNYAEVDPRSLLGTNTLNWRVFAGVRAFVLLSRVETIALDRNRWQVWLWALLDAPVGSDEPPLLKDSLAAAFGQVPDLATQAAEIVGATKSEFSGFLMHRLTEALSAREVGWLGRLAVQDSIPRPMAMEALRCLFELDASEALRALAAVLSALPGDEESQARASGAIVTALAVSPRISWPVVFPLLKSDRELATAALLAASHAERIVASALEEEQVAELWRLMQLCFPLDEDPVVSGVHMVSERESAGQLRDHLLPNLAERGSRRAVALLETIATDYPELRYLKRLIARARQALARNSWTAHTHREVMAELAILVQPTKTPDPPRFWGGFAGSVIGTLSLLVAALVGAVKQGYEWSVGVAFVALGISFGALLWRVQVARFRKRHGLQQERFFWSCGLALLLFWAALMVNVIVLWLAF
ncbi:NACHT domain-containing protein [Micromonospora arida]|uniref:NACHT domain-containing protein n=1 Tax=Micromonospora arida TaxID=2203715 RepID=UPI0033D5346E